MNAPANIVPPYRHSPLFPLGPDPTPYRKISSDGVRVENVMGKEVVVVAREALRALAEAAFIDINHLLRPGHLKQLRVDPRRSGGLRQRQVRRLRFPQERQYRGRRRAADVPGHRHRHHHGQEGPAGLDRRRGRGGARRRRARCVSEKEPALFAARAALDVRGDEHQEQHAGAGRDLCRGRRRESPTSSCSSPRAAARPTNRSCSRRRPRSSPATACSLSSRRRCSRSAPPPARPTTSPS